MKRKSGIKAKGKSAPAKLRAKTPPKARAKQARSKASARPKTSVAMKRRQATAAVPPDALDVLVAASAQSLNLPLDPAWHGGVKFNLHLILRLGALVDEFPLPDDAEPAPVFYA